MKISLYYNKEMYLLQDDTDTANRIVKITDENIREVENTLCLYHDVSMEDCLLVQSEANIGIIKNNIKTVMGSTKPVEMALYATEENNYGFGVNRIFLKKFFEKYKVKEIHPLHYVLKRLNNDGLFAIASQAILFYKDFKPDLSIGGGANEYYTNPNYSVIGEHATYDKDKENVEEMIKLIINDTELKRIKILSGFDNLDIGKNYEAVEISDIMSIIAKSPFKIVDRISDIYKQRQINTRLVFASIFLALITASFVIFYLKNELSLRYYESQIEDLTKRNELLSKKISETNDYLPKINLNEFNIDKVADILKRYTKYVPEKVKYAFKDSNTINISFIIKNAYFAENLIKELQENKIKHKYQKSTGYSFTFDIEEKIGGDAATKSKKAKK